ncbi:Alpha/Beta hydrolase protein [Pavlovales sp. CCMP2436]|nr:Alpha/Beta hydrolase protein [Pavlovales sp. CCMP2436]|mmetsp:Transcript_43054/g.106237  ORF Transcript_43054/g.106237 Transcript_43054/m.106237 type:complete len:312 (+) Transcript_43054:232-1167(+)
MPTARARDGCVLYYELVGSEGPCVIYCPSWGSDLRKAPGLQHSPLGRSCQLLLFDARGTGRSDSLPAPRWASPRMAVLADDVADLLDAVGWPRVHVLGCSFGAQVALTFASRCHERVASLALVNSHAGGGESRGADKPVLLAHALEDMTVAERMRRMIALADLRRDEAWFASPQGAAIVRFAVKQEEEIAHGVSPPPAGTPTFAPGFVEGRAWLLAARRNYDLRDKLREIGSALAGRLLVVGATHDGLVPPGALEFMHAELLEGARAALPDGAKCQPAAELIWMESGHWPSVTSDPSFWPRVLGFFARSCS